MVASGMDEAARALLWEKLQNHRLLVPVHAGKIVHTDSCCTFQGRDAVVKVETHHRSTDSVDARQIRLSQQPLQTDGAHPLSDDEKELDPVSEE